MRDQIIIEELELSTHIGVPEAERQWAQRLTVTLTLEPAKGLRNLDENIARTIDYAAAAQRVQAVARAKPRILVETLAEEMAAELLAHYPLSAVEVRLRKYILPDTKSVGVHIRREAAGQA